MQNSVAPCCCASVAASMTSSTVRRGCGFTGLSNTDDCEQNEQSSGQPPVLPETMDSSATSALVQATRTRWARSSSASSTVPSPSGASMSSSAIA